MAGIIKNSAKCLLCGDVLVSTYRHDFVSCSCGNLFIDGGLNYLRMGLRDGPDTYESLVEFENYKEYY